MTDEVTIFGEGATPTTPEGTAPAPLALPDSVKDLVGPGKKYATVEKALEGLAHSQNHIATLETENRTLREKTEKALSVDQVYETVQELLAKERMTSAPTAVDEATIAGLLDRTLTAREQAAAKKANVETVKAALKDKFGDKAEESFKAKAAELGVGVGFLNDLAAASPKAVLEYFGTKPAASLPPRTSSTVNTDALSATPRPPGTLPSVMAGATTKQVTSVWAELKKRRMEGN